MAFNMKGSPAKMGRIQGTAGHASALKMKAESALKQKNKKAKTYEEAFDENLNYQADEGEGDEQTRNYGKVDKWGRKYEGSNTKGVKGGKTQADIDEIKKTNPDSTEKVGDYKWGETDYAKNKKGKADFKKAAEDWNMKTYGTKNPTKAANAANMTKKEYAAKYKASKTKADSKTTVATEGENKGKTVVQGLGAKKSKTLTPSQKATERVKIEAANTQIKKGKSTKDKNMRDAGQLEKGEIKSGRDNKKTGTVVSRWFGKQKVKRNKRQLKNRNAGKETNGTTSGS